MREWESEYIHDITDSVLFPAGRASWTRPTVRFLVASCCPPIPPYCRAFFAHRLVCYFCDSCPVKHNFLSPHVQMISDSARQIWASTLEWNTFISIYFCGKICVQFLSRSIEFELRFLGEARPFPCTFLPYCCLHCCPLVALLLPYCCPVVALLLPYCCLIVALLLRNCCPIAALLLPCSCSIAALLLPYCCSIAANSILSFSAGGSKV